MIILLHNDVGKYTQSKPQKCWHSIRQVARRLKCELNVGEVTLANLSGVIDQIKNFTTESNALTSRQVYQEIGDLAGFFNGYQLDRVGGLDEKMALPEDSDAEGCEETVKEGLSENYEEETSSAGDYIPEIIDTSSDDASLPANVLPTAYNVEGYLLEDKFCNITMNKIHKLFLASTFHMSAVERNQLTGRRVQYSTPRQFKEACTRNFLVCWDHCYWSFCYHDY